MIYSIGIEDLTLPKALAGVRGIAGSEFFGKHNIGGGSKITAPPIIVSGLGGYDSKRDRKFILSEVVPYLDDLLKRLSRDKNVNFYDLMLNLRASDEMKREMGFSREVVDELDMELTVMVLPANHGFRLCAINQGLVGKRDYSRPKSYESDRRAYERWQRHVAREMKRAVPFVK